MESSRLSSLKGNRMLKDRETPSLEETDNRARPTRDVSRFSSHAAFRLKRKIQAVFPFIFEYSILSDQPAALARSVQIVSKISL